MRLGDHLDDAHHALLVPGMIEEAVIAFLHRAHVAARLEVAHAVPFLTGGALRLLLFP
jgi:hypothetical protein